jgi:hypothetical protein
VPSAANGKNVVLRIAARVEGTPTGGSGSGANWTADLARTLLSALFAGCARPLRPARARVYFARPMAWRDRTGHASAMPEKLIDRDEVVALLFNVADIATAAIGIETLLREEEDGGEEEADED